MTARSWDVLWRDDAQRKPFTKPYPTVVDLVPRLVGDGVRRVLDLGCGVGRHVVLLAREGFDTHAIDASESAVAYCRDWLASDGLTADVRQGDIAALPYADAAFDFALSWNVIYHTTRAGMVAILAEVERVLRPGALFYLSLNSTRNEHCGHGTEVEPDTYDNPDKVDGEHLHHYSDEADVRDLMARFEIESIEDVEQGRPGWLIPGTFHWNILARRRAG